MKVSYKLNHTKNVFIEDDDTWNIDVVLAHIIVPLLLQYKNENAGVPARFIMEVDHTQNLISRQSCFDFMHEDDPNLDLSAMEIKAWNEVLDKMIWSFTQILDDTWQFKYYYGRPNYEFRESETRYPNPTTGKIEKCYTLVDKNLNERWYDSVGENLHIARIQEGLDLFSKYFRDLWT